jgi:hypothetical protein
MPADPPEGLELLIHHDEDVEVFVNGVLAASAKGFSTDYEEAPLNPAGKAALQAGRNLFAVHCHQTSGGQYIDVGIIAVKETPPKKRGGG